MNQTELPIKITPEQLGNPYVAAGLAERAFLLAGYDFTPDGDRVQLAQEQGFLVTDEV